MTERLTEFETLLESLEKKKGEHCTPCHISYGKACYWFVIHSANNITFDMAGRICGERDSTLGFPVDSAHYENIMTYIRSQMPDISTDYRVWTGLQIVPSTKSVTLQDGNTASYLKWKPNEPTGGGGDTNIYFFVLKDSENADQGMADYTPSSPFHGTMCQFELP